jgi:hypothetical protein
LRERERERAREIGKRNEKENLSHIKVHYSQIDEDTLF